MLENKEVLIIFTRYPVPGKVKTGLVPALGKEGAAEMQKQMTEATLCHARKTGLPIEVWYTGATEEEMCEWLGPDLTYVDQGEGEPGERMDHAFQTSFKRGIKRVVIIGSDCPSNRPENIQAAFEALQKSDVVLGPSTDGGYYLVGVRSYVLQLIMFEDLDWGSAQELKLTLSSAAGVRLATLPALRNINGPADIPPIISVIIPTVNNAETIGPVLASAADSFGVELLVVDGGSHDDTAAFADAAGARVIESSAGRAHQMNAGAGAALGKILLFLYPDTRLPSGWDEIVRNTLSNDVVMGAFRLRVEERLKGAGLLEWSVRIRSEAFDLPCGEQAFFMTRDQFEKVGGFPDQPVLEDYELARRIRKAGSVVSLNEEVFVARTRWENENGYQTVFKNQMLRMAYRMGIPTYWLGKATGKQSNRD